MRRGEIWTVAGGPDYAGKPQPAVILQDDRFSDTKSVTLCGFSTNPTEAPLFRIDVKPNDRNGLREFSRVMVDKITSLPTAKLRDRLGQLDDEDVLRVNRAVLVFLGLASSSR